MKSIMTCVVVLTLVSVGHPCFAVTPDQAKVWFESTNSGCQEGGVGAVKSGRVRGSDKEVTVVEYGCHGGSGGGSAKNFGFAVLYGTGRGVASYPRGRLPFQNVESVSIQEGFIVVNTIDYGPRDPGCCPTVKGSYRAVILNGKVELAR